MFLDVEVLCGGHLASSPIKSNIYASDESVAFAQISGMCE